MARQLRLEYEGAFYHVTARGNERRNIYFSEYDYQKIREYLGTAQDKYGYKLHCYVLMTNHYHILIETPNGIALPDPRLRKFNINNFLLLFRFIIVLL